MWSFYFLAKVGLFFAGYLRFDVAPNVLFLVFTLVPLPQAWKQFRWAEGFRLLVNGALAVMLVWHDSWLPPIATVVDFLIHPNTAPTPRYAIAFLSNYADFDALALGAPLLVVCILAQRWRAAMRAVPAAAVVLASIASLAQDRLPVENSVRQFFATEATRAVSFTQLPEDGRPFDIILVHACSMSWDDLEVAGLADDRFFRQFDILFTQFSGVTSYSGTASRRLLRSACGQSSHDDLYGPARNECYLLDQLRRLGFKTYSAMDHDGIYADFSAEAQRFGHLDPPASLEGIPVRQHNFDDSPIFDGFSVLERWWRARSAEPSKHAVLYYNTITMHEGSYWDDDRDWWERDRISRYRQSAERFFDTLGRFFAMISASGRDVVVILVPEHGTALRSSAIQAPGLRELPLPQITHLPVAVKFFGKESRAGAAEQLVIREPVSYFALASLISAIVKEGGSLEAAQRGLQRSGLPSTRFLAENQSFRVTAYEGGYFASEDHGPWHRLPDRAVARRAPGERALQ